MEDGSKKESCWKVHNSIVDAICAARLGLLQQDEVVDAQILTKCGPFNLLGSIKDRRGLTMVEADGRDGVTLTGIGAIRYSFAECCLSAALFDRLD